MGMSEDGGGMAADGVELVESPDGGLRLGCGELGGLRARGIVRKEAG